MILDLRTTRPYSESPVLRDAALGHSDWKSAAELIAQEAGVTGAIVQQLQLSRDASPVTGTLLASRGFVRRWRHAFGEALAHPVSDASAILDLVQYDRESIEQKMRDHLARDGVLHLAIDSELGFHALSVRAQEGAAPNTWRLLDHLHELSLAAVAADEVRAARQDMILRLLDLGHTAAFVIDSCGWVRSENGSARELLGEILHFPAPAPEPIAAGAGSNEGLDLSSHFPINAARERPYAVQTPGGRRLVVYAAHWNLERTVFRSGDEMLVAWDTRADAPLLSLNGERCTDDLRAALRATFGLTRMESLLAAQLLGSDLRTAAQACGMAYETARSHLKSMFGRMKVRSQGELTALLARFAYHERLRRMLLAA